MFGGFKRKSTGQSGEDYAVKYLKKNGFSIMDRNYSNTTGKRIGEIDIIATRDAILHFVEVKSRIGDKESLYAAEQNINSSKLRKLERISQIYLKEKNLLNLDFQFDAIIIVFDSKLNILHFKYIECIYF